MNLDFRVQTTCADIDAMVAAITQTIEGGRWTLPAHARFEPDETLTFAIDLEDGTSGFVGRGLCVASYPGGDDQFEVILGQVTPEEGYEDVLALITNVTSDWVDDGEIEDAVPSTQPSSTFLMRPSHPRRTHPFRDLFENLPSAIDIATPSDSEVHLDLPSLPPRPAEARTRPLEQPEHLRASNRPPATRASQRPSIEVSAEQDVELLD